MPNTNTSANAANIVFNPFTTDLRGFVLAAVEKYISQIQTCIPAIIKKVEGRDTVIVTPAVQQLDANWDAVNWADIRLPVYTPAGGKFLLSAPLTAGDTGYIIAGDLDPALFQAAPTSPAPQKRLDRHNYQFGYFIPAKIDKLNLSAPDGSFVISSEDEKTQIVLEQDKISIKTSSELRIEAETVIIEGSSNVTINGTDWATHNHTVPAGIAVQVSPSGTGATTGTIDTLGVNEG